MLSICMSVQRQENTTLISDKKVPLISADINKKKAMAASCTLTNSE